MTVRRAREVDLDDIGRMAVELVRAHHALDPARFLAGARRMEEGYRGWLASQLERADAVLLVDEHEGALRGYLLGRLEPRDWMLLLDRHANLVDVFVRPEARRAGVASALVEAFVEEATKLGAPRVVLTTAARNEAARALFARFGFRETMVEMTRELG